MKLICEECVGLLPIIELVIVRSGIEIFVPLQGITSTVQLKERQDLVVDVRFHERRQKTAVILRIVHQQSRPRSAEGDEERIVQILDEVSGILLNFIRVGGASEIRLN